MTQYRKSWPLPANKKLLITGMAGNPWCSLAHLEQSLKRFRVKAAAASRIEGESKGDKEKGYRFHFMTHANYSGKRWEVW